MKRRFSKVVAIATSLAMVISTAMPAFADTSVQRFPDISGHWAATDLTQMVERGIMGGYPDGTMKPQQAVTVAESIKLINQSLKLEGSGNVSLIPYTDVKKNAWYSAEVAIAVENGYLAKVAPGGKLNPSAAATREQLSSMFAQAMKLKAQDEKSLDKFKDSNQIASGLKLDMAAAVEKGLFGGYEDNTIRPKTPVIRATMAAVANRTISDIEATQNQGIKLGANDVLIQKNGETLTGKELDTVWISPLTGTGTITLENIIAKKVVIMGKESSVVVKAGKIETTEQKRARVGNGESKIGIIEYKAPNSKLDVQSNSTVDELKVGKEAKGSTVSGNGIVKKAVISADNFKLNTIGTEFTVESGVTGVTVNGTSAPAGTSGKSKTGGFDKAVVSGGGGSGGGGGGGTSDVIITGDGYSYNVTQKALTVTGNNVTIDSSKLNGATSVSTLSITGDNVTINGITVTGETTISGQVAQGRSFNAKALAMPVRSAGTGVNFNGCTLATVTMSRDGLKIEFKDGSVATIKANRAADVNFEGTVTVTTFEANAAITVGGTGTVTITKMEIKVAGITVTITNGRITEIVVDAAATITLEGVTVDKIDARANVDIQGNGTIKDLKAGTGVEVKTDIKPEKQEGGTVVENKYNYGFRVSDGKQVINIVEKQYTPAKDMMSFAVVSQVYSEIENLSEADLDKHIDKAMPTVKKMLELKDSQGKKYVNVLDNKIQTTTSAQLTVFVGDAKTYVGNIAAGIQVDKNVEELTKVLVKANLEDILYDLAVFFPNEAIPAKIEIQVINEKGQLVNISNKQIAAAQATINADLGKVPFSIVGTGTDGKVIVQISMDNAQTILALNIKRMTLV